MRLFLKKLGYEASVSIPNLHLSFNILFYHSIFYLLPFSHIQKYANLFEAERVGMIELPYLGEERLQKLGVPLGPRLRILQEAQISLCKDTTLCIV